MNRADEIYFQVKKALMNADLEALRRIDFNGLDQEERRLRAEDVTNEAINRAKERSWRVNK